LVRAVADRAAHLPGDLARDLRAARDEGIDEPRAGRRALADGQGAPARLRPARALERGGDLHLARERALGIAAPVHWGDAAQGRARSGCRAAPGRRPPAAKMAVRTRPPASIQPRAMPAVWKRSAGSPSRPSATSPPELPSASTRASAAAQAASS